MSSTGLRFVVLGKPVPQGSKRIGRNRATGRALLLDDNDRDLKAWRGNVSQRAIGAALRQGFTTIDAPCDVHLTFFFTRPAGHYGTGRNAGQVKPSAPPYPSVKPDLDKLVRGVLDALTAAAVWFDDSRVVNIQAKKRYAAEAGITVYVRPAASEAVE